MALGLWFFAQRLGVDLPPLYNLWPALPFAIGAGGLLSFVSGRRRSPAAIWNGVAFVLVGAFFFGFTLGPLQWSQMQDLWPVLPMIAGVAFLATWMAGGCKDTGLLVPSVLGLAVGAVGLGWTLELLQNWLLPAVEFGWPLLLIALGLALVVRSFLRPASESASPER